MMNKYFKYYAAIWALLLVIFNVAVFASPDEAEGMSKFGGAFWSGYVFITLAFTGQLIASFFAFKAENVRKFFYKISLIRISWTGLVLTIILGTACMIIPNLPNWVGIIACFVVLAFHAIAVVKAELAAELVSETDEKLKVSTALMKTLTAEAKGLEAKAQTEEIKAACKKAYEALRYSDPMSSEELAEAEGQIAEKLNELKAAVGTADNESVNELTAVLLTLIKERNDKCKLLK